MKARSEDIIESPLKVLTGLLQDDLDKVNALILSLVKSQAGLIPDISKHTISSGGKRLRPLMTLAFAKLCGYEGWKHVDLAASIEFFHTASLLHDDVVDESTLRRGQRTANFKWGNKESILVGDFLLGKAFQLISQTESLEIHKIFSNSAVVITEGEVLQLSLISNLKIDQELYFKIIEAKTAELFASACEIPAILTNKPAGHRESLRKFGLNLGTAYQIIDDVIDYSSAQQNLGKDIGNDFREKKLTLPIILAYQKGNDDEKKFWNKVFDKDFDNNGKYFNFALEILNKHGVLEESIAIADELADEARLCLDIFPPSELKTCLNEVLHFIIDRDY